MALTRRRFIDRVARAGGYGAAYVTMQRLGLLPMPVAYAGPPDLAPGSGSGTSVVILGAGLFLHETVGELPRHEHSCLRIFGEVIVLEFVYIGGGLEIVLLEQILDVVRGREKRAVLCLARRRAGRLTTRRGKNEHACDKTRNHGFGDTSECHGMHRAATSSTRLRSE